MSTEKFEIGKWYKIKDLGIIVRCSAFDDSDTIYFDHIFWADPTRKDRVPYLKGNLAKGYPFSESYMKSYNYIDLTKSDFLTPWEQIKVLKGAKRSLMKSTINGLCFHINFSLHKNYKDLASYIREDDRKLSDVFPLFRYEIAQTVSPSPRGKVRDGYWWHFGSKVSTQSRKKYLDWMINLLKKELTPWQRFWSKIL